MLIGAGRFGAAVLARPFWCDRFGAGRFGAEPFWRRRFGATVLAQDVLAQSRFGAGRFGAGRFGARLTIITGYAHVSTFIATNGRCLNLNYTI